MGITINSGDDRDEIERKFGNTLTRSEIRQSDARKRRLESSSQRRTRNWGVSLEIDPDHDTAHVDQERDSPHIVVSGRAFDQPVTSMDEKSWDWLVQRALSWHEAGHVLYTNHGDFKDRVTQVDNSDMGTAKQLWNALEDAAIERQIIERWNNAYDVLRLLRANLFDEPSGIADVEKGGYVYPVTHATHAVLMGTWMEKVYGIEAEDKRSLLDANDRENHFATEDDRQTFMDHILQPSLDVVDDVLSEPDSVKRNRIIFDYIHEILPYIADTDADGRSQMNRDEGESPDGMPDDATESAGGDDYEQADALGDVDPDDIEVRPAEDVEDIEEAEEVELPDDVQEQIEDMVSEEERQEAGGSEEVLDELEEMSEALKGGGGVDVDEIEVMSEEPELDTDTFETAKRESKPLAQLLANRLQRERKSEVQRNQRRGRFTGRGGSSVRGALGEKRVKERVSEPDEKDYHFAFIVDRSGSMNGSMSEAERALGMLSMALEEVGVEVMIIELHGGRPKLSKPFGASTEDYKNKLFNRRTSGGTPLSQAVDLTRKRLNRIKGFTALTVITDGEPASYDDFEKAIRDCSMPTLGVNLTSSDSPSGMDDYDRAVATTAGSELSEALRQLIQEIMF